MLILLIFWGHPPPLSSAESNPGQVESVDLLIKHLYRDTEHILSSPLRWRGEDLLFFATLSVSTFAMMLADADFQNSVQKNRTFTTDRISRWTDKYTKRVTNLAIGGLYLSGFVLHDRKAKETALLCLESVALAEGITKCLKYAIGRSRPFGNQGAFDFNPLRVPPPAYSLSFPSGHATTAFALSSVMAERYPSWWVRVISYGFALVVSAGRVNNNAHFLSDVFWGGIIGTMVGRCVVRLHRKGGLPERGQLSFRGNCDSGIEIAIRLK